MIKRLAMVAGTFVLGIAGTGLAATQAWASNSSTGGCVTVYIEYESINATQRRLHWVESRNACGNWNGHFQTGSSNGPDTSPVRTHRINLGGQVVNRGGCIEGVAWRNDGGGRYFELGRTCTAIA